MKNITEQKAKEIEELREDNERLRKLLKDNIRTFKILTILLTIGTVNSAFLFFY